MLDLENNSEIFTGLNSGVIKIPRISLVKSITPRGFARSV